MDESSSMATTIMKFCILLMVCVIILINIDLSAAPQAQADEHTSITLSDQPSDGDTLTIGNEVYEFDTGNGVITGHIAVLIGATKTETTNNLVTVINTNSQLVSANEA